MKDNVQTLPPRSLGRLLDDTFAIYIRKIWRFIALAAIVEAPLLVVLMGFDLIWGTGPLIFGGTAVLFLLGSTIVNGSVTFAVGQQYLTGEVGISNSLRRAWWRILTLMGLAIVLTATLVIIPLLLINFGPLLLGSLGWLVILPMVPLIIGLAVYWFVAVQVVVVEDLKILNSLKRSYLLVQGSWVRVFGFSMILGLTSLGLGILVTIPITLPLWMSASPTDSTLSIVLLSTSQLAVRTTVLPVIFIANTLLYYDLRVRKEQYSILKLTQEMNIAPAN